MQLSPIFFGILLTILILLSYCMVRILWRRSQQQKNDDVIDSSKQSSSLLCGGTGVSGSNGNGTANSANHTDTITKVYCCCWFSSLFWNIKLLKRSLWLLYVNGDIRSVDFRFILFAIHVNIHNNGDGIMLFCCSPALCVYLQRQQTITISALKEVFSCTFCIVTFMIERQTSKFAWCSFIKIDFSPRFIPILNSSTTENAFSCLFAFSHNTLYCFSSAQFYHRTKLNCVYVVGRMVGSFHLKT